MSASTSMRAPLCTALFTVIAMLTLWASPARATTILHESFPDLVEKSEVVVVGTLLARESRYGAGRNIYTFWTLGDLEIVSGVYAPAQLELRVLGGEIGGDRLAVLGAPTFAVGERVLLFIRGNGRYAVPLVGWTQGVFRVRPDGVVTDHEGKRVSGVRNRELEKERGTAPALTLDTFRKAIRAQAAELDTSSKEIRR